MLCAVIIVVKICITWIISNKKVAIIGIYSCCLFYTALLFPASSYWGWIILKKVGLIASWAVINVLDYLVSPLIPAIVKWDRDRTGIDRIWHIFLIPGNGFLLRQGITCNGKCECILHLLFVLSYMLSVYLLFVVFIIGHDSCFNTSHLFVVLNQILFFSGVTLTIGFKSTMQFFMKRQNFKVFDVQLFSGSMSMYFNFLFSPVLFLQFYRGQFLLVLDSSLCS